MNSEASKTPSSHAGVYAEESGEDEEKEAEVEWNGAISNEKLAEV